MSWSKRNRGEGGEGPGGKAKIEENVLLRKFGCNGTGVNENIGFVCM